MPFQILDIAEGLLHLDPVRTYPQRGAALVAKLAGAAAFRLDLDDEDSVVSDPPPEDSHAEVALPLRNGRQSIGTLHLSLDNGASRLGNHEMRLARWGGRVFAKGMHYAKRLTVESGRRSGERVKETLERAPLTPRERDVVALLVAGSSTREIAKKTGLTVATVNTYLKRIFSKLGVHSRVELVARMAGTHQPDAGRAAPSNGDDVCA